MDLISEKKYEDLMRTSNISILIITEDKHLEIF